ncbi:uncharacterized protein LOC131801338 [Musca domestica]|uniref:Uncharacterized protein LOC131801338 n=1 Tax=Musca domestica TaxID=7370 RepID=A0ABM3UQQ4_MUSDO|nr:uncharacterized protein LOC131801338 [Musca domestica]
MVEGDDCRMLNECFHTFHRSCVEAHMSSSNECPVCKRSCELNELRDIVVQAKNVPVFKPNAPRGKGRGAMSKQYNTRSSSRNLFQDNPVFTQNQSRSTNHQNVSTQQQPHIQSNDQGNCNLSDFRYYAKVSFLDVGEYGLIDTAANSANPSSAINAAEIEKWSNLVSQRFFKI